MKMEAETEEEPSSAVVSGEHHEPTEVKQEVTSDGNVKQVSTASEAATVMEARVTGDDVKKDEGENKCDDVIEEEDLPEITVSSTFTKQIKLSSECTQCSLTEMYRKCTGA